jgi:hypothetical protein
MPKEDSMGAEWWSTTCQIIECNSILQETFEFIRASWNKILYLFDILPYTKNQTGHTQTFWKKLVMLRCWNIWL